MTLGELDYENDFIIQKSMRHYSEAVNVVFVLFCLAMPIILMNMLVCYFLVYNIVIKLFFAGVRAVAISLLSHNTSRARVRGERGSRDSLGTRLRSGWGGGVRQVVFALRYFFALFPHCETWCPTGPRLSREKKKRKYPCLSSFVSSIYIILLFRSPPVGLRKERRLLAVLLFAAEINDDRVPKNHSFYMHKYR